VVANLFGLRNTLTSGRFVWMKERQLLRVNSGNLQSPEDMAEEFIFRKFAGLNSAAVAYDSTGHYPQS